VLLASIVAVIAALFIFKPAPRPVVVNADERKVVIISPHSRPIQMEFERAFIDWHQRTYGEPVAVEWQDRGGASGDVRFIRNEFSVSPNGIGIDIFWGGGGEPYILLAERGVLEPFRLPEETLRRIPPAIGGIPIYDAQYRWYGSALSAFGIIYNRNRLRDLRLPEPKTWEDLGGPGYFGAVGAADPRESGSALAVVEVILQAYGWEKGYEVLMRIAGNVRTFTRAAGEIPKNVALGEYAAGLAIDFYARTQMIEDKKNLGLVLPAGLTPLTPDSIAVLKGAPHKVAAHRFVGFVMSEEGQRLWVLPVGVPGGPAEKELLRIPAVPDVYLRHAAVSNVLFDPAWMKATFRYDPAKAAARRDALKDLYGAVMIELRTELRDAWQGVIRRGLRPEDLRRFCAPPVTEAELAELSSTRWSDSAFRNAKITEWTNQARERYRALAK
jgi:ABC-type Fe3+ transport system substrate-binding protein